MQSALGHLPLNGRPAELANLRSPELASADATAEVLCEFPRASVTFDRLQHSAVAFFGHNRFDADDWCGPAFQRLDKATAHFEGKECAMSYSITLRSRTDARITGWYDGSDSGWSTDHKRQKLFDNKRDASPVCEELRSRCPRNAVVINIEVAQDDARKKFRV